MNTQRRFRGITILLIVAAVVLISQYWGKRDMKRIKTICSVAAAACLLFAVLYIIAVRLFPRSLLRLVINAGETQVIDLAVQYLPIVAFSYLPYALTTAMVGMLKGVEVVRVSLYAALLSLISNVIFNYILICGHLGLPAMGVTGAAIATVFAQAVSVLLSLLIIRRRQLPFTLTKQDIRFEKSVIRQILKLGIPVAFQDLLVSLSFLAIIAIANVVVQSNINTFGSDAMAGCGSYSKVEGFVFLPITAFAMALTTFIGQNLGAGQFDRAKQGARIGILCSMAMAELIGVALFFLAPYAMRLFNDDPAVVAIGVRQSHIEALFFCFLAFAHGVSAVLRGAGRAQVPMYTMLGCWCILRVSYITLALKVWPDIATIFWAYPITWSVSCVVFLIYYLKADWVHALEKSL